MLAELFRAIFAGNRVVAAFNEALGVSSVAVFPLDENNERDSEQGPRERMRNKNERGKHHSVIPVIYSAGCAAFVLEYPGLEWAEEENADDVAY